MTAGKEREDAQMVGPYRLVRRLGSGGMGVVHLATDRDGRQVALKVLRSQLDVDSQARLRLAREFSTLSWVRHPRVAEVLDADVEADPPYLVTRFVPGRTLESRVHAEGGLPCEEVVDLGVELADALNAIHATGVVHRDVKPPNVMLVPSGPVLIDFGIAHVVDEMRITMTGLVMGTPGYLSPEIYEGNPVTPAADWWGWGATLAFAATGRQPFGQGPLEAVMERARRGRVDVDGVAEPLRSAIRAALTVRPEERPNGDELAGILLADPSAGIPVLASERTTVTPPPDRTTVAPVPERTTVAPAAERTTVAPQPPQLPPDRTVRVPPPPVASPPGAAAVPPPPVGVPPAARHQEPGGPQAQTYPDPSAAGHGQSSGYAQPPGYGQSSGYGQAAGYAQPSGHQPPAGAQGYHPGQAAGYAQPSGQAPYAGYAQPSAPYPGQPVHPGQQALQPAGYPQYPAQQQPHGQALQPAYAQHPAQQTGPARPPAPVHQAPLPAPAQRRLAFLITTAFLTVTALTAAVVPLGTGLLAWVVLSALRAVDRSQWALAMRRGPVGPEPPRVSAAGVLWRMPMSLLVTFLVTLPAILMGCIGGFVLVVMRSHIPEDPTDFTWSSLNWSSLGIARPGVLAAWAAGLLFLAWWGPGGSAVRRGSRTALAPVTRRWSGVVPLLGFLALVLVADLLVLNQGIQDWVPLGGPPLPS